MDCQKHLFSLPSEAAYLNVAYQAPLLKSVEEAGIVGLRKKQFPINITREDFFDPMDTLKQSFARLIGCGQHERVAILSSVSYGIAIAAKNIALRNGQNIVLVDEQFPSNYYTWERLCREKGGALKLIGPGPGDVGRGQRWGEAILNAINDQTAAVSMGHVHWADGTKFNLKAIGEKCRKYGAKLIVDGTQSVGALPFDINEIKPDALICAGYKWLMGPYSIAVGYFGPHFDGGVPIEENWINRKDSDQFEKLVKYQDEYRPLAWRYNMGECSNFIQVPMLTAAIDQLVKWTPAAIQDYCARLQAPFLSRLKELGCTVENDEFRSQHLFGIKLPENVDVIALKDELALRNVFVSIRGAYVRVAPHVYNEPAHFDMLVGAIQQALQVGAR